MSGRRWLIAVSLLVLVAATIATALPGRRTALAFTQGVVSSDPALIRQTSALGRDQASLDSLLFESATAKRPGEDFAASPVWLLPLRSAWRVTWSDAAPGGEGDHETVVVAKWTPRGWRVIETNTWFVD